MPANPDSEKRLTQLLNHGSAGVLRGGYKGLEKESLRVDDQGRLAHTRHPESLGSALTHPNITTDYSEALLELVTPPLDAVSGVLEFLSDIHSFVYQHLQGEMLWATSMPCRLEDDAAIPIAEYGHSNIGMMKHVYRRGLGWRYGRSMQTIAGVHFNYSFPKALWPVLQELYQDRRPPREFIDESYFSMLRNFQRVSWLVPYFFGASPAVCKSFFHGREPGFKEFDAHTLYEPYATSLRMSDIGYKNKNQSTIGVRYNSLADYIGTLTHAISTPYPDYQRIGVKVDGEYRQLNANILQIENEFYSFARPKQPIHWGERPTLALEKRGVLYAEIRALDVNVYDPVGTDAEALCFMEALLLWCLLTPSPPISEQEQEIIARNQSETAHHGRDPALRLVRNGHDVRLREWAGEITAQMEGICAVLDGEDPLQPYLSSLKARRADLSEPERLPSARILADMHAHGESFFRFAKRLSESHRELFMQRRLSETGLQQFRELALDSLKNQRQLEDTDRLSFDEFLQRYFSQT